MNYVEGFTIILAIFGIAISVFIANKQKVQVGELTLIGTKQQEQMTELTSISKDTKETARKLKSDARTREIISVFLGTADKSVGRYTCVFPIFWDQKPLPLITSGDYHAIQVIQNFLGAENVDLLAVAEKETAPISGNVIYLCSPKANIALESLAPAVQIINNKCNEEPKFDNIILPCWFGDATIKDESSGGDKTIKTIWIPEHNHVLRSPSDDAYINAAKLRKGDVYKDDTIKRTDYSILMRLSINDNRIVVIAGIHQYGTWTCGDFFQKLIREEIKEYSEVFMSQDDIVAVIWGEFNAKTFKTERCGVYEQYLWTRKNNDVWKRVQF